MWEQYASIGTDDISLRTWGRAGLVLHNSYSVRFLMALVLSSGKSSRVPRYMITWMLSAKLCKKLVRILRVQVNLVSTFIVPSTSPLKASLSGKCKAPNVPLSYPSCQGIGMIRTARKMEQAGLTSCQKKPVDSQGPRDLVFLG